MAEPQWAEAPAGAVAEEVRQLRRLSRLYLYCEAGIALLGLPLVLLALFLILTRTPKDMRFMKYLLVYTVLANFFIAYGVALLRPIRVPGCFGGFATGLGLLDEHTFVGGQWLLATALAMNAILSVLSFRLQVQQLQVSSSCSAGDADGSWRTQLFFFSILLAVEVVVGVNMACYDIKRGDEVEGGALVRYLARSERTFAGVPMDSGAALTFSAMSAAMVLVAVGFIVHYGLRTRALIRRNAAHVSAKTMGMQRVMFRFLVHKMVAEVVFFFAPLLLITVSPNLPRWTFPLSASCFCCLSAYSVVHCANIIFRIRFYRAWLGRRLRCGRDARKSATIATST